MTFTFPTDSNNKAGAVRQNSSGTGFHVPTIIYGEDGVTPVSKNNPLPIISQLGSFRNTLTHTEKLTPGTSVDLIDTDNPTVIDMIDWVTRNEDEVSITLELKGGGSVNFINRYGTGTISTITPQDVASGLSLIWDIVEYNLEHPEEPLFRFHLKHQLFCPRGVRITLYNNSTSKTLRNSCQLHTRRLT